MEVLVQHQTRAIAHQPTLVQHVAHVSIVFSVSFASYEYAEKKKHEHSKTDADRKKYIFYFQRFVHLGVRMEVPARVLVFAHVYQPTLVLDAQYVSIILL